MKTVVKRQQPGRWQVYCRNKEGEWILWSDNNPTKETAIYQAKVTKLLNISF